MSRYQRIGELPLRVTIETTHFETVGTWWRVDGDLAVTWVQFGRLLEVRVSLRMQDAFLEGATLPFRDDRQPRIVGGVAVDYRRYSKGE